MALSLPLMSQPFSSRQEFYHDAAKLKTPNAPEARGKAANMYCFFDANHAKDKITRCSYRHNHLPQQNANNMVL
jgi:hypothetical protein